MAHQFAVKQPPLRNHLQNKLSRLLCQMGGLQHNLTLMTANALTAPIE